MQVDAKRRSSQSMEGETCFTSALIALFTIQSNTLITYPDFYNSKAQVQKILMQRSYAKSLQKA